MTRRSYFDDTYNFSESARMMRASHDERGHFIVLNQSIFYPQGGGQPSDQGTFQIENILIPIHSVKSVDQEIWHYTPQDFTHLVGQEGICILDRERRLLHARLHTAGHLIGNVIECLYPQWVAVKGHHFPEQCYVQFTVKSEMGENVVLERINKEIEYLIKQNLLIDRGQVTRDKLHELYLDIIYSVPKDQPIRVIRIGDFPFAPCGGTHVKCLQELCGLKMTNFKVKNNLMRVYYCIG